MFKRGLVLGGLVAGAFLLPTVASALVNGPCVNCHTMHNSQNGVTMNGAAVPYDTLLVKTGGCAGCHADASENIVTGYAPGGAPQVDGVAGVGYVLNGGYFTADAPGQDAKHHNVNEMGHTVDANFVGKNIPGSNPVVAVAGADTAAAALTCQGCHSSTGHHASTNYRMLPAVATTNDPNVSVYGAADATAATVGTRGDVNYEATEMNGFCGTCHSDFHLTQAGSVAGTWARHPTGVSIAAQIAGGLAPSVVAAASSDAVPQGFVGAVTDYILCLSCHVPHGGPNDDLLSFAYDAASNVAGGGGASVGCESCHSYAGAGM